MNEPLPKECRQAREALWPAWPQSGAVGEAVLSHAAQCPGCRQELEEFRALFLLSTGTDGAPLSWPAVLPPAFWDSLAAEIKAAPRPGA